MNYTQTFLSLLSEEDKKNGFAYSIANLKLFKQIAVNQGHEAAIKFLHDAIDAVMDEERVPSITCRKGCSFCCHINVTLFEWEAEYISQYCRHNNIAISQNYLKKQLSVHAQKISYTEFSACVFLKDNICSIYSARPVACRMHMVMTEPQLCDTKQVGVQRVGYAISTRGGFLQSILAMAAGKYGRMPRMLLPYSL